MSDLLKLQGMYDSEINFRLECFWDGGFSWYLGDEMNGFKEEGHTLTLAESIAELRLAAHRNYPESVFHLGREEFLRRRTGLATQIETQVSALKAAVPPPTA